MARESEWDRLFRQGVILPLSFEEQNPFLAMVIRKQEEKRAMEIEALARIARRAMFPENEGWEAQWSELSEGWRRAWCRVAQAVLDAQASEPEPVEPRRPKLGDIVHYVNDDEDEHVAIVTYADRLSIGLHTFGWVNKEPVVYVDDVSYSKRVKAGTWHFPEDD